MFLLGFYVLDIDIEVLGIGNACEWHLGSRIVVGNDCRMLLNG